MKYTYSPLLGLIKPFEFEDVTQWETKVFSCLERTNKQLPSISPKNFPTSNNESITVFALAISSDRKSTYEDRG